MRAVPIIMCEEGSNLETWRHRADSNRWSSFCRALPCHLATVPELSPIYTIARWRVSSLHWPLISCIISKPPSLGAWILRGLCDLIREAREVHSYDCPGAS